LLGRETWAKYPEEMLTHKAVARAIDNFCPEVLGGMSMKEDMEDTLPLVKIPKKPDLAGFESQDPIEAEIEEEAPAFKFPRNMHVV
jgi:hypothetical protein